MALLPRILIAGVGNIFLGDDAFGVEVVQRLAGRPLPKAVRVVDFGIRGLDLAFTLLDDYEAVILVDALARGGQPGTLYVLEPDVDFESDEAAPIQAHNLDPLHVLQLVKTMGGHVRRLLVVGCEPTVCDSAMDLGPAMSAPVRAAVDEAVTLIESIVKKLLKHHAPSSCPIEGPVHTVSA